MTIFYFNLIIFFLIIFFFVRKEIFLTLFSLWWNNHEFYSLVFLLFNAVLYPAISNREINEIFFFYRIFLYLIKCENAIWLFFNFLITHLVLLHYDSCNERKIKVIFLDADFSMILDSLLSLRHPVVKILIFFVKHQT